MGIEIKNLSEDNVEAIYKMECECFSTPWSLVSLREDITNELARYFVLYDDGEIVAYLGVRWVLDELHIMNIAVSPEKRRAGYAKRLLNELLDYAHSRLMKMITLEARQSNIPAIELYTKYGFERCGIRSDYYDEPTENAILMVKYL